MPIDPQTFSPTRSAAPAAPVQPRQLQTPVTYLLIGLNALVFIAMVLRGISFTQPTVEQLIGWGANFGPLTLSGQWWRLLTSCFLHIGIIHIGFNMFVLYQVGPFTERLYGGARFLALYLIAGIFGNVLGLVLHPMIVSAGASGAIFGVYGGLLAFLRKQRTAIRPEAAKAIGRSALIFLGYNLVYGLASPNTDLTAHIGGLFAGFLAGWVLARPLSRPPSSTARPVPS